MNIEDLGYNNSIEKLRIGNGLGDFDMGRVIAEHKERYIVKNEKGEFEAEITGNLRFSARNREDFPAVGDWVSLIRTDSDLAIIHSVLPRLSMLSRPAIGKFGERQIIATNIDFALLVQAVDRDFNINRLERYLTLCYASKISPVIVLSKIDLIDDQSLSALIESLRLRLNKLPILTISNETKNGTDSVKGVIKKGKTYCLLGSSGVGKSTLINTLSGRNLMKTNTISESTHKGRHVTSHRELTVLDGGGILIDNPGMREVGIADSSDGLETAFDSITRLSMNCKFSDCSHTTEIGCAVRNAVEKGELDADAYDNYMKIEKEKERFSDTVREKRKKERAQGKIYREVVKHRKNNKY